MLRLYFFSVLVMDNARIHHGDEILELVDRFGVCIEYLTPCSPDLNPIKEAFSQIKSFIRRNNNIFLSGSTPDIISMSTKLLILLQMLMLWVTSYTLGTSNDTIQYDGYYNFLKKQLEAKAGTENRERGRSEARAAGMRATDE